MDDSHGFLLKGSQFYRQRGRTAPTSSKPARTPVQESRDCATHGRGKHRDADEEYGGLRYRIGEKIRGRDDD
jgi:hypothetical protein